MSEGSSEAVQEMRSGLQTYIEIGPGAMRCGGALCLVEVVEALRRLTNAVAGEALEETLVGWACWRIEEASAVHRARGRDCGRGFFFVEGRAARRDGALRRLCGTTVADPNAVRVGPSARGCRVARCLFEVAEALRLHFGGRARGVIRSTRGAIASTCGSNGGS